MYYRLYYIYLDTHIYPCMYMMHGLLRKGEGNEFHISSHIQTLNSDIKTALKVLRKSPNELK